MTKVCALIFCSTVWALGAFADIQVTRVPDGGIQPQVAVDSKGSVHLIYFKGDPAAGNLFYARSPDGGAHFSPAIRVNSVAGSAIAVGNIRGGRIALGRKGHVYVAWNGSAAASGGDTGHVPMLYSRLNVDGTAFEPERNLIHTAYGIDGGGGIAADQSGHVYVVWHAPEPGTSGEAHRQVWMARSTDDGKTFAPEEVIWNDGTGACGCCSLDAFTDSKGQIYVLFRSARELVHRDMYLLVSKDRGESFHGSDISKWDVGYCVMSSEAFAEGRSGVWAAWETEKQIHFGQIDTGNFAVAEKTPALSPGANQKYPALAENANGSTLLAWTEGMGWKKSGSLDWQIFDRDGKPVTQVEHGGGQVPAWSLVAAYARPDGGFTILY
ncbi:MAG: glycoside hydrolase [Acidobacteriota bacterium]|nr:glycoside hydrolase [Acidobacteriota bacterium]